MLRLYAMLVCAVYLLCGDSKRPEFQDYPASEKFGGVPAAPRLTTTWSHKYRTRMRQGTLGKEGFRRGSEYVEQPGPNFAGKYRVVNWGCGSGCLMMAVVDLTTGQVYPPPMSAGSEGDLPIVNPNLDTGWADFDFRLDSTLFVMRSCRWGSPDPKSPMYRGSDFCESSYFTITSTGFRLVKRIAEQLVPPPE